MIEDRVWSPCAGDRAQAQLPAAEMRPQTLPAAWRFSGSVLLGRDADGTSEHRPGAEHRAPTRLSLSTRSANTASRWCLGLPHLLSQRDYLWWCCKVYSGKETAS